MVVGCFGDFGVGGVVEVGRGPVEVFGGPGWGFWRGRVFTAEGGFTVGAVFLFVFEFFTACGEGHFVELFLDVYFFFGDYVVC